MIRFRPESRETFDARALSSQGLKQWPTRWIGTSRVWINGEDAPQPASSATWDLPGGALERWGVARACAAQPRRGKGAMLASLLVFHANLSTPEVNYFCGDGCARTQPRAAPTSKGPASLAHGSPPSPKASAAVGDPPKHEPRPACRDKSTDCAVWAAKGECASNPKYMDRACAAACGRCASASA